MRSVLTRQQLTTTGGTQLRLDQTFTPDGLVATQTRYRDTAGTLLVGSTANTFDAVNNVTHIQHKDSSNTTIADFTYSYDGNNLLTSETDANPTAVTTNYQYDGANQLIVAGTTNYSFDLNGNRTMSGYQTGLGNELLSDGTWNYSYDPEGNVIQMVGISNGLSWQFSYDLANRMTQATLYTNGSLTQQVTYKYDVFGNRVETDVYTASTNSTTVQRFAYDRGTLWADLNSSNALVMRYLWDGAGQLVGRVSSGGTAAWYLHDHLGSIRALTDNSGVVQDRINYDAYGNITSESNASFGDRWKYTNLEFDSATGLLRAKDRDVNPLTGHWMQQDPIPNRNLYPYVGNDPMNATDPSGLAPLPMPETPPAVLGAGWQRQGDAFVFPGRYGRLTWEGEGVHGPHWDWMAQNEFGQQLHIRLRPNGTPLDRKDAAKFTSAMRRLGRQGFVRGAALAAHLGATIVVTGVAVFAYDLYVDEGERMGMNLVNRITLGRRLQVFAADGGLPAAKFDIQWNGKIITVNIAQVGESYFITAWYFEDRWHWYGKERERVDIITIDHHYSVTNPAAPQGQPYP